ncbi:MAG: c-type cytochrome [Deltaproteobacteria bacterium]|nr:c-type cytochrome [Deltaproteobacteria bacterium]
MKKWKRVLLWGVSIVAVLVGGVGVFAATYAPPQRKATELTVDRTPQRIQRGEYLATHVLDCFGCHSARDWTRFGGPLSGTKGAGGGCLEGYGFPGRVCFPNITQDPVTGIGAWSDDEILRAIREGVDRSGRALFPMMPYQAYRDLSDDDAHAVVAYLRSLAPVENTVPKSSISFPASFFIKMAPKPITKPVPAPDPSRIGEYLANLSCKGCHTPLSDKHELILAKRFAGGHKFDGPFGSVMSKNITPHESGLGNKTREEFVSQFRGYADVEKAALPLGNRPGTVMPWLAFSGMTEEDLGRVYDYLRSVPPLASK